MVQEIKHLLLKSLILVLPDSCKENLPLQLAVLLVMLLQRFSKV